jgi:hypothetical protein
MWLRTGKSGEVCKSGDEPSGLIKCSEFLDYLRTISLFYAFFWVIPRCLEFKCRRFGTLCQFHLHRQVAVSRMKLGISNFLVLVSFYSHLLAYEDGTDRVFRNVGILTPDTGEVTKRKHTTYRTRRKLEINKTISFSRRTMSLE